MRDLCLSRTAALPLALTATLVLPRLAAAHVKWFVPQDSDRTVAVTRFDLSEPAVQLWVGVILASVAIALLLERWLPGPPEPITRFCQRHGQQIAELFQVLVGLALLVTAVKGAILAPHLEDANRIGLLLRFVEGAIGVLLIANKAVRVAAGLMIVLFVASTGLFGFVSSLEYFNFLGIAVFLLLWPPAGDGSRGRFHLYAVPLLRIHTGVALGVLAWTEKLFDPSLAVRFLEQNQVNFMSALGADMFSDRLFVLCAGCSELLFAIIFALGLITRINTLSIAVFLISSNTYFFVVGKIDEALLELTGHLPLFAIAMVLIVHGSGSRLRLPTVFSRTTWPEAVPGTDARGKCGTASED